MSPGIKFAIKLDTININNYSELYRKYKYDFFVPWVFRDSILKIVHFPTYESEGYFMNHYNDKNIHFSNSIVMDV